MGHLVPGMWSSWDHYNDAWGHYNCALLQLLILITSRFPALPSSQERPRSSIFISKNAQMGSFRLQLSALLGSVILFWRKDTVESCCWYRNIFSNRQGPSNVTCKRPHNIFFNIPSSKCWEFLTTEIAWISTSCYLLQRSGNIPCISRNISSHIHTWSLFNLRGSLLDPSYRC